MPALRTLRDAAHEIRDPSEAHRQGTGRDEQRGEPTQPTRRPRIFTCSRCPKSYSRRENLIRHLGVHDVVGRFGCHICQKNFSRSDLLHRHRKSHEAPTSAPEHDNASGLADELLPPDIPIDATGSVDNDLQRYNPPLGPEQPRAPFPTPISNTSISNPYAENHLDQSQDESQAEIAWGAHLGLFDTSGLNIGTFDGDMAWTLGFAQLTPGESIPDELLMQFERDPMNDVEHAHYRAQENPIEVEEDETGQWPDRISRPASPSRLPRRRNYQNSQYWLSIVVEAGTPSADLGFEYHNAKLTIDASTRDNMVALLKLPPSADAVAGALHEGAFPPTEVLNFFLRLYVRHVHERFPIIHLPTFSPAKTAPILLLGMLVASSGYSESNNGWFTKLFFKRIRSTLVHMMDADSKFLRSTGNLFALLLICVSGTWSGARENYEFAEGARGILVTASRRSRLLDCRPANGGLRSPGNGRVIDQMWEAWIDSEQRKRLGLAVYLYDCQFPALFNNQPYISKAETANAVFPCGAEYWDAPTSDSWKMLLGPANIPPSTYYLHALNCCLLRNWEVLPAIAKTDNFGKLMLLYALHGHIFEWRQAVSMLNPNGLANSYGNCVFQIGGGLEERKTWLLDSLNNWYECYWTPDVDVAAKLLYYLAFVALDVSLSDVHLAAGRSGSRGEGEIAEQSLQRWANGETAEKTMLYVEKILELAHTTVAKDEIHGGSFEVAVGLFTGGLVCAVYDRHRTRSQNSMYKEQVHRASQKLQIMGCWQMCSLFGVILEAVAAGRSA